MSLNTKVVSVIQARMGSTRLPKKVLIPIYDDKSLIDLVYNRVSKSKLLSDVICAIPYSPADKILAQHLSNSGYKYFVGSESNVLERFYQCCCNLNADFIVRVCADRPFIHPEIIDYAIGLAIQKDWDYVSNFHLGRTYPIGLDIEVFKFSALEKAWLAKTNDYQKEHVTPYIYENCSTIFRCHYFSRAPDDASNFRVTIDEEMDFKMVSSLIKSRPEVLTSNLKTFIEILKEEVDILKINKAVIQYDKL